MEIRIALIERGLESDLIQYGKQVQVIHKKIKVLKKKILHLKKLQLPVKSQYATKLTYYDKQKEDLQAHYLCQVNNNTITHDSSQLVIDESHTEAHCDKSTTWESLQEGDIIKVRFDVSEGAQHVYGKVKIVTDEHYYVDDWSDGDLKYRKISIVHDDWQRGEANEYVIPIVKKQKQDPTLPTVGQQIKVPFYQDSKNDSYGWLQGEIKIERGSFWMVHFSDGEVYKIMKNSKWIGV